MHDPPGILWVDRRIEYKIYSIIIEILLKYRMGKRVYARAGGGARGREARFCLSLWKDTAYRCVCPFGRTRIDNLRWRRKGIDVFLSGPLEGHRLRSCLALWKDTNIYRQTVTCSESPHFLPACVWPFGRTVRQILSGPLEGQPVCPFGRTCYPVARHPMKRPLQYYPGIFYSAPPWLRVR